MGLMPTREATSGKSAAVDVASIARHAVDVASDKQASDITLLDIRDVSGFADYMIIMAAGSIRQVTSLADDLTEAIERRGLPLHHREGTGESGWVLLDFPDLVVHIFTTAKRDYYRLEQVWSKGKTLLHIQ